MNRDETKQKQRVVTVDSASRVAPWGQYRWYARLRLQGRWLERAGFSAGTRVTVAVAEGRLVISRAEG